MTSVANKRVQKELTSIFKTQNSRPLLDNDYLVSPESTLDIVKVIMKAPSDSVYANKFIRLNIHISDNYPFGPPTVYFINHTDDRIHPNIGEGDDGKCCSTILNTWGDNPYEKWASCMSIESIVMGFMSLLDNDPYQHEPGNRGDDSYTTFVLYQSWYTCLFEYIEEEDDDLFQTYINEFIYHNIKSILKNIENLEQLYASDIYTTRCYEIGDYELDFYSVKNVLLSYYENYCSIKILTGSSNSLCDVKDSKKDEDEVEMTCSICYDTRSHLDNFTITLRCNHTFHIPCLESHFKNNSSLCPLCRGRISVKEFKHVHDKFITSKTGKRYRKNGRTWKRLYGALF